MPPIGVRSSNVTTKLLIYLTLATGHWKYWYFIIFVGAAGELFDFEL